MYDAGPRSVKCPLICFPPASGTADVFFRQILALSAVGYRVIAVSNLLVCYIFIDFFSLTSVTHIIPTNYGCKLVLNTELLSDVNKYICSW